MAATKFGYAQLRLVQRVQSFRTTTALRTWAAPGIPLDEEYGIPKLGLADKLQQQLPAIEAGLSEHGYFSCDNFLGATINAAMRADAVRMRRTDACGDFKFTQSLSTGADGVTFPKPGVFSAELDGNEWDEAPHLLAYTRELMLSAPAAINATFESSPALSLAMYGTKLAVAEGGGSKYPKHVDNACECDSGGVPMDKRKISIVYYLNPQWAEQPEDGGAIRLWSKDNQVVDFVPEGDRVVIFWSDTCVHEVLANTNDAANPDRHRWALTVWLVSDSDQKLCDMASSEMKAIHAHFPSGGATSTDVA